MSSAEFVLPTNIDEVIEQLEVIIQDSLEKKSRMGYFAALYKRVTVAVKDKIEEGYFDDNPRMEKLDVIFASRYLLAYHQYQNGQKCSTSWKIAFDSMRWWSPLVIQHLFVGMNAHIGLDLGIAASEVQPTDIDSIHDDFDKINVVLGSLINEVQDQLSSIFWTLKPIDWILGGVDEKVAKFAMDFARDEAWKVAIAYSHLHTVEGRATYIETRDRNVSKYGIKMVRPGKFINFFIRMFRGLEYGGVRFKINKLNS
ncbi:MAG: hypothetical protein ACJA0U_000096 [Salibacteraceae bacterium]|jgi:hypothetical protein